MFRDAKFCPHCGAAAVAWDSAASDLLCPVCRLPLLVGKLDRFTLHECEKCFGLWVDKDTVELICHDAEQQALAPSLTGPPPAPLNAPLPKIRYVPCPQCRALMHRVNFAHASNVVVDVCRDHGTWFDADELHRIVEFIRAGGLDRARDKQKAEFEAERRRHEAARLTGQGSVWSVPDRRPEPGDTLLPQIIGSLGDLLRHLRR